MKIPDLNLEPHLPEVNLLGYYPVEYAHDKKNRKFIDSLKPSDAYTHP